MLYKVQWSYQSGMGGPWREGNEVELDAATAAAINCDSPGVLLPAHAVSDDDAPGHVADHRRDIAAPPATRQVTAPAAKRGPGRPPKAKGGA